MRLLPIPVALSVYRTSEPVVESLDLTDLPAWMRLAYADLDACARQVGARASMDNEILLAYLTLSGPEEGYWPARAYWRELVAHMGDGRRRRLAMARLWPEFVRFSHGRRSPGCAEVRRLWLGGGRPRGLDCLHVTRCEHCRLFGLSISA